MRLKVDCKTRYLSNEYPMYLYKVQYVIKNCSLYIAIYSVLISDVKGRSDITEPAIDSLIHRPKLSCLTIKCLSLYIRLAIYIYIYIYIYLLILDVQNLLLTGNWYFTLSTLHCTESEIIQKVRASHNT